MFKSNLNEILRGRYKSEEQKSALENIKLLYKSREAVIKLFNDSSSIISEAKYRTIHEKEIPSMSACVAKVSNCKFYDHLNLKILNPKRMVQRLPTALAQVKAGNTSENLSKEITQITYSLYQAKGIDKNVYNNMINSINL